ncbi:V-1 protein [Culex quinquefasciatus]|uniref:V-1 protein n=1 Tax=Culex quinquefasciatus TaxID=7176 RepID=B0WAL1_CULQU|nr:V-1 protein [Culex quinquefasciatus]|eukprot:XP_001845745.1 V-1 protein [Culex quinquefasciatus]
MQVNCLDDHGLTPLHYAARTDQRTVIELLMGAGSTIDAADKHGSTPLLRAVSKGHMECFELLRRHGANVELLKRFRNSNYDNETMLHITAEKGLLEMTKMLVEEYHLNVDCQDKDAMTLANRFRKEEQPKSKDLVTGTGPSKSTKSLNFSSRTKGIGQSVSHSASATGFQVTQHKKEGLERKSDCFLPRENCAQRESCMDHTTQYRGLLTVGHCLVWGLIHNVAMEESLPMSHLQ